MEAKRSDTALKLEIARKRTVYAVDTFVNSWVLSARRFFPLFGAWALTVAGPVFICIVGVIAGFLFDQSAWGAKIAWALVGQYHVGWGVLSGFVLPAVLIGWLYAGWIMVSLKVARGLDIHWMDLFRPLPQTLSAGIVLIITTLGMAITAPLIIVAPMLFMKLQLAPFYVVDRKYGPIKAMQQSWKDTDMVFVPLAMMDLMFVGIHLLTAATVFGPLICTIGTTVASALVYSKWMIDNEHPDIPKLEL